MEFKNRPNTPVKKEDGTIIWHSRSVGVVGVVILYLPGHKTPYVLVSRRGPKAADYRGKLNVISGYLDWDENGQEALFREGWEETGLNLLELAFPEKEAIWYEVIANDLDQPWFVKTDPSENLQNVALRYGFACKLKEPKFPDLSLDNNEIEGEVSEVWWMPVTEINSHEWAFEHDKVIKNYLVKIGDHIMNYY